MSRILVIDDERGVQRSLWRILTGAGHVVDTTGNGRQGLEWATREDYDLVIADTSTPRVNGMRILQEIKRLKPAVPVIIITGYGGVQSAVQYIKLGASDYLQKPLHPGVVIESVAAAQRAIKEPRKEIQNAVHENQRFSVMPRAVAGSPFQSGHFETHPDVLRDEDEVADLRTSRS